MMHGGVPSDLSEEDEDSMGCQGGGQSGQGEDQSVDSVQYSVMCGCIFNYNL